MHERDVAGEKVRQLREKESGAQIAHQPFVDEGVALFRFAHVGEDRGIDRDIALAAAGGDDHVGLSRISAFSAMPASVSARPAA